MIQGSAKQHTWETISTWEHLLYDSTRNVTLPGARVVAQLVHVRVVLGHYGDGVTLLADDETSLLLRSVPQVDAIVLSKRQRGRIRDRVLDRTKRGMKTICARSIHGFRSLVVIGGGDSREGRQRIYFYSKRECMLHLLKRPDSHYPWLALQHG